MVESDYRSRMLAIVEQLHAQGVGRYTSAPPAYRLAWRIGIRIQPPIYQSSTAVALQTGIGFAAGYGLLMWFLFRRSQEYSSWWIAAMALIAGVGFGVSMAAHYRWIRKDLRLPPV